MSQSTSLEATLAELDRIVDQSCSDDSHCAIFPAMYRSVTAAVHRAVRTGGFFDDDERVEHLTVEFADLYIQAYDTSRDTPGPAKSWMVAFEAARAPRRRMILQHLLLGMNAHINLDLGLATVSVARDDLSLMRTDFNRVNEILFQILEGLQDGLGTVSPRMALIDRLGGSWDERVMRVGIRTCRNLAWRFANQMAAGDAERVAAIRDADTAWLGRSMLRTWSPTNLAGWAIAGAESQDLATIVAALDHREVDLAEADQKAIEDVPALESALGPNTPSLYQCAHHHLRVRRHVA